MLTPQNGGPYGLGAAIIGSGRDLVLMKRGQNVGYQGYMLLFPATGQGMVVMTRSDNGTTLATALIRRAACGRRSALCWTDHVWNRRAQPMVIRLALPPAAAVLMLADRSESRNSSG
jgi:hypothetical protein